MTDENNNLYDIGIPISEKPSNNTLGRKIIEYVTATIDEDDTE